MKKIAAFAILAIISLKIAAQTNDQGQSTFFVNVLINENKDIRIESDLIKYENVSEEVKKRIFEHPFKLDESITYRIFADKNLLLGYIMDVEQKLFDGYSQNARRERHLLETSEMEIDGPNWLKKLKGLNFDKIKG